MKEEAKTVSLSMFFPAYNEEKNIKGLLDEALKVLPKLVRDFEIIVINDGSRDNTADIVKSYLKQDSRIRLVNHHVNRGYGAAVWSGFKAAKGNIISFSDSDRQFRLSELKQFLPKLKKYDVVVGYRNPRRDPFVRKLNAQGWKLLQFLFFGLRIKDVDCAFKVFRREALQGIKVKSRGAMLSAELLIELKRKGCTIYQQPVTHYPRKAGSSTGAKLSVITRAFSEFWRVYLSRRDLVRSRSLIIYSLAIILLFLSRLFFLSHSFDFFDSTQYGWRATLGSYLEVMTSGHPPFHPLYNLAAAFFYRIHITQNPVIATSLPSAFFGSLSVIFVFLLLKKLFDNRVAWLASILYALSSFVWISQITVLVDATEHLFYFASLYLLSCAFDNNSDLKNYLLSLAAGLSFGLAGFAHTQVALWSPGILAVIVIANQNWDRENLKKILLKLLLFAVSAGFFILAYLPLLIYASAHRTDITLNINSYRSALKYLLLGNIGDHTTFIKNNYIRYIFMLGTVLGSIIAFCGFIKLVKNDWKKAIAILIWFLPSSIVASTYIYENLYGRALIIGLVPFFALTAYFILGLKFKCKILLGSLIVVQVCAISIPAVVRYKDLPAANESLAQIQKDSSPDGVFISSNVTRTWSSYQGKFVNFGDVGVGAAAAEQAVNQALDAGKVAFVSSDAISLPFRRYDGIYWDLRSVNVGNSTGHGTMLSNLFSKKNFTLIQSSNNFEQFVYSLNNEGEDLEKTFSLARNSKVIIGRIVDQGRDVPSVDINSFTPTICAVQEEDITRRDGLFCLERLILKKKRPENWTFSDADGWFALPTKSNNPRITLGLLAADLKSTDPKLKFVEEKSIDLVGAEYLGTLDQSDLEQLAKNQKKSFYGISKFENGKVSFDVYTFDLSLLLTDKIEAENLSGEVGKIEKDKLASGGYVKSTTNAVGYLTSGPYIDLSPGRYKLIYQVSKYANTSNEIIFDAVADEGKTKLAEQTIDGQTLTNRFEPVELTFDLQSPVRSVEFRVKVSSKSKIKIDYIRLLVGD